MPASASPPPSPPVRTPGQQPSHPASATNRSRTPQNDRFALYSPRNPDRRWIRGKEGHLAVPAAGVARGDRDLVVAGVRVAVRLRDALEATAEQRLRAVAPGDQDLLDGPVALGHARAERRGQPVELDREVGQLGGRAVVAVAAVAGREGEAGEHQREGEATAAHRAVGKRAQPRRASPRKHGSLCGSCG